MTDSVIEASIRRWPKEIFDLHGPEIIRKLKARRETLPEDARAHYKFLAKEVDVVGSNKAELIEVVRGPDGDVAVKMFKLNKEREKGKVLYDRVFKQQETKAINLYSHGGDDKIEVSGNASKSILVRVISGEGIDTLNDKSHARGLRRKTVFNDNRDLYN